MIILLWFLFSVLVAVYAASIGRSGFWWFVIAALLSPLIGIICLLVVGKNSEGIEKAAIEEGGMKKCPQCAELIKAEAVKCRYCGSEMQSLDEKSGPGGTEDPEPTDEADLMARYDIKFDRGKYVWRIWSYDRLEDAATNARETLAKERATYG